MRNDPEAMSDETAPMRTDATLESVFDSMYPRIQAFLNDTLSIEEVDDKSYIDGSRKIDFYAAPLRAEARLNIEEYSPQKDSTRAREFEEALFERLLQPRPFNLLVLLGGLGAGKTTTVRYLLRRFSERRQQIMKRFICTCDGCFREPIYLDFRTLDPERSLSRGTIIPDVLHELRLAVYDAIVKEWLNSGGNNHHKIKREDPEFMVLRRLFIANDLLHYQGSEFPRLSGLHDPALRLEQPLTSMRMDDSEIIKIINIYKGAAGEYREKLEKVVNDPFDSIDFMRLTLKFYLYRCNPKNPMNLIILDNLDQLPTRNIEELLRQLHNIAQHAGGLPLLVPLRPSSINPHGFVREILFRYHYGPNNFRMILSRLERYILNQSRASLRVSRSQSLNRPFIVVPTENEIDALLVVAYLYAQIMLSGLTGSGSQVALHLHEDHQFLRSININHEILFGLAETCDALVGACCRYGLDVMRRFFDNAYGNSRMLLRAIRSREAHERGRKVRLSYSDLITSLLRDPVGDPGYERVPNLFEATRYTSNPGWPTLAKLRILSLLTKEKRQEVETLVQRLALFGIPMELTVDALNSLQVKFRLLLWFSTNRQLEIDDENCLKQDVVISEHGERYFRRVVGDFEYVWFCATALNDRKYTHAGLTFSTKLSDYKVMVQRLGETEWKQICFNRLRAGCLPDVGGVGHATRMEVLNVLYASLGRALLGADTAMRAHEDMPGLASKLTRLVEQICEEIQVWQKRYQIAFGSKFYLSVYRAEISQLQQEITGLLKNYTLHLEEILQPLAEVQLSWLEDSSDTGLLAGNEIPEEDIVTVLARYGRGMIPGIKDVIANLDKQRKVSVFMADFLNARERLSNLLRTRLPTSTEVQNLLRYLLADLDAIVSGASEVASTGEVTLRWCIKERRALSGFSKALENNEYDVPELCSMERMNGLKLRFNNVIAAIDDLGRHLGILNADHLRVRWQGIVN